MADPTLQTLRERVRALKKHAPTTGYDSPIRHEAPRARFRSCVDYYFDSARNPLRNIVGDSRALKFLDESMQHLLSLAQKETRISDYQAALRVIEGYIDEIEIASTLPPSDPDDEAKTAFGWIRRVEVRLRKLIESTARATKGPRWAEHVEQVLGTAATTALATMQQRGKTAREELIHFTQLMDVVHVISQDFHIYAPALGITKKQFNTLRCRDQEGSDRGDAQ